jgi:hypothetical protein
MEDASRTIFQPATGRAITPTIPGTNSRVVLIVSDRDAAKIVRHLDRVITVTDLMTGDKHRLTGDDCGSGCRCAVTFAGSKA